MAKLKLRESIAVEAARLVLRGKQTEFSAARRQAARWLSRRKVDPADMPSDAEIHSKLYALAGFFSAEQQRAALSAMRNSALQLMDVLAQFQPRVRGNAVDGPATIGSEITLDVRSDSPGEVLAALQLAQYRVRLLPSANRNVSHAAPHARARIRVALDFPCEVAVISLEEPEVQTTRTAEASGGLDAQELREVIDRSRHDEQAAPVPKEPMTADDDYHPDTFPVLRMMLSRLKDVQQDVERHPEGDALYHSLQVFDLALQQRPYDEEFLLACLLHDVGLGIDHRDPIKAARQALEGLLTQRTCFLITRRPEAREYLKTGKIARSLRRSEHFDDLVLLAQCDLKGRIAGAETSTLDEALEYIGGLSTAWDNV